VQKDLDLALTLLRAEVETVGGGLGFEEVRHVEIELVKGLDEPLKRRSRAGRVDRA
jgi:hypothetical protein